MSPKKKVALITGASSGLGKELSFQLAAKGWDVFLLARRESLLKEICSEITKQTSQRALYEKCDVSDENQTQKAIEKAYREFSQIDLLIANAGISEPLDINNLKNEKVTQLYKVNVFGVLNCIHHVAPKMIQEKSGHIVGISSLASYVSFAKTHPYCSTKAALSSHLQGLRFELYEHNIHVTTICPGYVRTPLIDKNRFPMPFIMDTTKATKKILWAIERKKHVYNFPWQAYWGCRLFRILPFFMQRQIVPEKAL